MHARGMTVLAKCFYAGGIQVAQMVNHTTYYLHQDALGSTRLVMPASMVPSFSSDYGPYGMSYAMVGEEAFQYTGKLLDEATGLYYEGARYYDPATGRFITEDSYNGTKTDPISQNKYIYGGDNPMRYVDPTGHYFVWWLYNPTRTFKGTTIPTSMAKTSTSTSTSSTTTATSPLSRPPDVTLAMEGNDQYAIGPTIGVSTTSTTPTTAPEVIGASPGSGIDWNAAGSITILIGASVVWGASFFQPYPPLVAATTGGEIETFAYLDDNPNPSPEATGEHYVSGFVAGLVVGTIGWITGEWWSGL